MDDAQADNFIEDDMQSHETEFSTYREITAVVMTWNAGASKPQDLRYDEQNSNFFRDLLRAQEPPDILVFGLQELVDLDDKKLTASKQYVYVFSRTRNLFGHRELLQEQKQRFVRAGEPQQSLPCMAGSPYWVH